MPKAVPPPLPEEPHRSADQMIREAGFTIAARPEYGQARWRRRGMVFLHEQALYIALKERQLLLQQLEAAHG